MDRVATSIALRSGAGCGKTFVLARRFAELLRTSQGDDPLRDLVALTFTDKAALEMLARVRKTLADFAAGASGEERKTLLNWIASLSEARISTIHAFCSGLLRAHAVEAGLDPGFAVCADKLVVSSMMSDAVEQAILESVSRPNSPAADLLATLTFDRLHQHITKLMMMRNNCPPQSYSDADLIRKQWSAARIECQAKAWKALAHDPLFKAQINRLSSAVCDDPHDKLAATRARIFELLADVDEHGPRRQGIATELAGLHATGGSDKKWGYKGATAEVRGLIKTIRDRFKDMVCWEQDFNKLDETSANALSQLSVLTAEAIEIYARQKRSQGLLDFEDLLAHTRRLIEKSDSPLGGQIRQLLVDEAQDTNAFHIALLRSLLGADDKSNIAEGKLFVVGDVKQSIYRFQGAQVEEFEALCRSLGPQNQESLDLSFRTHRGGVEFVNHLFAPLLDDYAPMQAHRSETPPGPSVEILLAAGSDESPVYNAETALAAQATVTAQRIAKMVADGERVVWDRSLEKWRPAKYSDIAILFSRMTNSLVFERQLELSNVPYYVVGGTGFFKQQEVYDVLNVLSAIDNPYNDIALMGSLRGAMFGLDDNALLHIATTTSPPYFPALLGSRPRGLDDEQAQRLSFAMNLLESLRACKDAMRIDELIERILERTGYETMLLSRFHGKRPAGNVRRLVELARAAGEARMPLAHFIAQMTQQVIDQQRFEQAAVSSEADNVVRLMTIHKAKGLEFPVVFMSDLNTKPQSCKDQLLHRSDWGLTLQIADIDDEQDDKDDSDRPLSCTLSRKSENLDAENEYRRLLYVGATRHEDMLVLVGGDWRRKDGAFRSGGSWLDLLDCRLNIRDAIDRGDVHIDYGQGPFKAVVQRIRPTPAKPAPASGNLKLLNSARSAGELAAGISSLADVNLAPPPMLGPLAPGLHKRRIGVTALGDFELCPMLYRWRHELRAPVQSPQSPGTGGKFEAATAGTVLHMCMQLLDFASPQSADALVARAMNELNMTAQDADERLVADLDSMIAAFKGHPLWNSIRDGQRAAELDFMLDAGTLELTGKIDLLFCGPDGNWRVLDYKSDRVSAADAPQAAQRYLTQLTLYSLAAQRYLDRFHPGQALTEALVYFLRPGVDVAFAMSPRQLQSAMECAGVTAMNLINAGLLNQWPKAEGDGCGRCIYRPLCNRRLPG